MSVGGESRSAGYAFRCGLTSVKVATVNAATTPSTRCLSLSDSGASLVLRSTRISETQLTEYASLYSSRTWRWHPTSDYPKPSWRTRAKRRNSSLSHHMPSAPNRRPGDYPAEEQTPKVPDQDSPAEPKIQNGAALLVENGKRNSASSSLPLPTNALESGSYNTLLERTTRFARESYINCWNERVIDVP